MPRQLKEIRNFNLGTILNLSEKDIPQDAAAFSLNVDPLSENGILNAINNDRYFFTTNEQFSTATPISWSSSGQQNNEQGTFQNVDRTTINNIDMFNDKATVPITFTGTKGVRETLVATNIQPWYEKITTAESAASNLAVQFKPRNKISTTSDSFTYATNTETIIGFSLEYDVSSTTDIVVDGFGGDNLDNGVGTIELNSENPAVLHGDVVTITNQDNVIKTYIFKNSSGTSGTETAPYITLVGINTPGVITSATTESVTFAVDNFPAYTGNFLGRAIYAVTGSDAVRFVGICTEVPNTTTLVFGNGIETDVHDNDVLYHEWVNVYISGLSSYDTIADQFIAALSHANGHNGYITAAKSNKDGTNDLITLTQKEIGISPHLEENDYISFADITASSGAYANNEIMKVESIDTDNRRVFIKRGCFGTNLESFSTDAIYNVYGNRNTFDGFRQTRTKRAVCQLSGWSDYSGNHIGGNSSYLNYGGTSVAQKAANGKFDTSHATITFKASDKTITFQSSVTSFNFYEGDTITFLPSTATTSTRGLNGGYSGKILKKVTVDSEIVLTMDTAPVDETMDGDPDVGFCFVGAGLLKGSTIESFQVNNSKHDVSSSTEYKKPFWKHRAYLEGEGNTYGYDGNTQDDRITPGGSNYWTTTDGNIDLSGTADNSASIFPHSTSSIHGIEMKAEFNAVDGDNDLQIALTADSTDSTIRFEQNIYETLAANDLIRLTAANNGEVMRVVSVDGRKAIVERGAYGTTPLAHSVGVDFFKGMNHGIKQSVSKDLLKPGQPYVLSFWAQSDDADGDAYGAISIKFNGGYIQEDGTWTSGSNDLKMGSVKSNPLEVMQEHRWIGLEQLDKPFGDDAYKSDATTISSSGLDNIYRKFQITFYPPIGVEFETDMDIEFCCRVDLDTGGDNGWIVNDIDLYENTIIYNANNLSLFKTNALLDNSGVKDLISYDSVNNKLKAIPSVFKNDNYLESSILDNFAKSPHATPNLKSSSGDVSIAPNNREVHIGFGSDPGDSAPQWLGYVNHTVFGKDYTNELYQDEDTVHKYNEAGSGNISKLCLAGEYEKLACTGTTELEITFTHANILNLGDNIVVREWLDTDNSWDGNGVWIVTDLSHASHFHCKRKTTIDKSATAIPNTGGTGSVGYVSFRPYYYYGIKDGEASIYRICPDDVITQDGSGNVDDPSTVYIKGNMERSMPIDVIPTSICTFYNKGVGGATPGYSASNNGGGAVYLLSAQRDEVAVINVMQGFDKWKSNSLTQVSSLSLKFKSFIWSNDNINGNISGDTEVFPGHGLSSAISPIISYAGVLSDILETKGSTATFDIDYANNDSEEVDTSAFDTRLWVQCRNTGETKFSEGDRYLFCGRTETVNTDGPDTIYCADRTPPSTIVCGEQTRYDPSGDTKFTAGPGVRVGGAQTSFPIAGTLNKYAYFYHYHNDSHNTSLDQLERISAYSRHAAGSQGTEGAFRANLSRPYSYMNWGYNVGYDGKGGKPDITVVKYGLFQIADNDGDGLIDGTGLVTANNKSITADKKWGPWGKLHQRVCSHVVGLIGSSDTEWVRHWGRHRAAWADSQHHGTDYFHAGSHDITTSFGGWNEDAPENMTVQKCLFISSDTHFGDDIAKKAYTWNAKAAVDKDFDIGTSGTDTQTKLTLTESPIGLQAGDVVLLVQDTTAHPGYGVHPKPTAVITYVDYDDNLVYINIPAASVDSGGALWAYTIQKTYQNSHPPHGGAIVDNERLFHFAYDHDDELNGEIFTQGNGSGHYVKHYYTPPCFWGMPYSMAHRRSTLGPGFVFRIEKLSFRAGVMLRPFDMDDDSFNDLRIGHGTAVDMPAWPNNVYHKDFNSKGLFCADDGTANNDIDNYFASKLFISSPLVGEYQVASKARIYQCDLNFMYPNFSSSVDYESGPGSETTSSENDAETWDISVAGSLESSCYITAAAADFLEGSADKMPLLKINSTLLVGSRTTAFDDGNSFREIRNAMNGMCITILDTKGIMQTRYIVGSRDDSGDKGFYLVLHYPLMHTPAAGDKFWIWKHSLACTAPVRLFKERELEWGSLGSVLTKDPTIEAPIYKNTGAISDLDSAGTTATATTSAIHGLSTGDIIEISDATTSSYNNTYSITVTSPTTFTFTIDSGITADNVTATWTLIPDSESSTANPIVIPLASPIMKASFGGLDMRKTKSYTIDNVADGTDSASEQKLRADANHLLITGDTITYDAGGGNELDGTYNVDLVDPDQVDITTTATDTDTGTAYTNQFEMIMAGTQGRSELGELRAGFNQWDKGNIAGNITRYDSTADADRFMNFSKSAVSIATVSLGDQTGDFFTANNTYFYKISFIYDGYQEGPLSESSWTFLDTVSRDKLSITLQVREHSRRLSHVCLYRRDDVNDFYKLVKEIPTESGWNVKEGTYTYILGDEGELGATYESRTGMSEILDTVKVKYGVSVDMDGYLFVGDCSHEKVNNATNMIFRSKPGMFSLFDYVNDYLTLNSKPTALANFNGRLYAFDSNNTYRINPETLAIEDVYEGVGCIGKNSIVVTDFGMFYADKNGAYMHTGSFPQKISESIQKGGDTEVDFGGTDNVRDVSWENVVTKDYKAHPYVTYDPSTNCALFSVKLETLKTTSGTEVNLTETLHYIWSYSLGKKRWDLWELAKDTNIGKPFLGDKGELYYPIGGAIYENRGGSSKKDYTWVSKKLTMNEDSIIKVFNKVKINGITKDVNLGGSNIESSDRLLIATSLGSISSSDIASNIESTGFIDYRLKGSNKKGRWIQIKAENMTEPIDSIGFIFRRKSTK